MIHLEVQSTGADDTVRAAVHGWLRAYNIQANGAFVAAMDQGALQPLTLVARNDDRALVGGLFADTLLSWLRVHIVAVDTAVRGTGIGTRLMHAAEAEAKARGCVHGYVDTMSYQSPDFYRKLGYAEVGCIPDWDWHGHTKHYFTKRL